jgi:Tol biopolymer transport system component
MGTTSPAHLKTRGARPSLARGLIAVSLLLIAASFIRGGDASPATQTSSEYLVVAALARPYVQMPVIMSSTGRVERVVARARSLQSWQARWSPDRTMLAWVGSSGLMVERAGGGAKRTLLATNAGCTRICVPMSFAWSPDGRRILVGGAGTQTARLLVVSVKTGHAVDLVPARAWTEYVVFGWSPNGRSIAYSRASGKWATAKCCKLDLVVAKSNGGNPRTLFRFREVVHDSPVAAWSPDGRSIAFVSEGREPHDPAFAVVDVAAGKLHRITKVSPVPGEAPAWSPDSDRLAVGLGTRVVTLSRAGGDVRSLGTDGRIVFWSRNGQVTIVRDSRPGQVWASDDGIHRARLLFRMPPRQAIFAIDPR